ncbi:MAG: cytochrome c [Chloroflexota bacterium]
MKVKVFYMLSLLIVGAVLIAACGGAPAASGGGAGAPAKMKGDATAGKTKFSSTCVSCHGPEGKGIPGLGKDMTTSTFIKGQSDDQMVTFVTTGRPASDKANTTGVDMPPKGGNPSFTEKDLYDIVAFIRTIVK